MKTLGLTLGLKLSKSMLLCSTCVCKTCFLSAGGHGSCVRRHSGETEPVCGSEEGTLCTMRFAPEQGEEEEEEEEEERELIPH